ncbi:MAG: fasciclin domain-containing protein [Ornithinibacter sp.]
MRSTRMTIAALALALPLSLAACGSDSEAPAASSDTATSSSAPATPSPSETAPAQNASAPFGPGCAAVPTDGKGSFDGMSSDPVATAASNNPLLSTLVTAVTAAGLGETLNTTQDITVFAPTNDAFAAMDQATLKKALADPKGLLTKVLTGHVIAGRLAPDQLAGEHETLAGTKVTVKGSGEDFSVGDAKVICGNVQTANATVYILDGVLLPAS